MSNKTILVGRGVKHAWVTTATKPYGVAFEAESLDGPQTVVADRQLNIFLTPADVAAILLGLPVTHFSDDPQLFAALTALVKRLKAIGKDDEGAM